jgi:alpha-ketoglutarate-dependent taurine dioxygenase
MKKSKSQKPNFKDSGNYGDKTVLGLQERLVNLGYLESDKTLPLVVQPCGDDLNLMTWAGDNREFIAKLLSKHGGILFRNFGVSGVAEFENFIQVICGELMGYLDRATPRHQVSGNVYTATDYPPEQGIFLHNESSFAATWPRKIFFYCVTAARQGGETPVADVRRVFKRIDPQIRERFTQKKVMYVRNFAGGPFGLSWQTVFQTEDKSVLEEYCRKADIEFEWRGGNRLRTRQVRPAVARHPLTGEMVWFNHATVLHVSTIEARLREMLLKMFKEEDLPNNTYYGDCSPIEPHVLDALRESYGQETVMFTWHEGDILMLDNMLVAHGRKPFVGPRKIVVGMAEPTTWKDI